MWYNRIQDTTYNPTHSHYKKESNRMKKYTALSLLALTCLSCNPMTTVSPDAGVPDAGTEAQTSNHVFEPQKITIAEVR